MKTATDTTKKGAPQLAAVKPEEQPKRKTHAEILRTLQRDVRATAAMAEGMWEGLDWMEGTLNIDRETVKSMISVLESLLDQALDKAEAAEESLKAAGEVTP